MSISISSEGNKAYVANSSSNTVSVIDTETDTVTTLTLTVGTQPLEIALTTLQGDLVVLGLAKEDRFLTQTDLYNQLRWELPEGIVPTSYEIYRDDELIAVLPGNQTEYLDHNRNKGETSTYLVVALSGQSTLGEGTVTISR